MTAPTPLPQPIRAPMVEPDRKEPVVLPPPNRKGAAQWAGFPVLPRLMVGIEPH